MADTIRCREFAPRPAAWPSGKAEDCKSFTPSSNLGAAFFVASSESAISDASRVVLAPLNAICGVLLSAAL